VDKATTTADKATTTPVAVTTTTLSPTVLEGEMQLTVDDTDVFQTEPQVVLALQQAMASLLEIPHEQVKITSIGRVMAVARRLKAVATREGKVKVGFEVTDPTHKITPKMVADIAPLLPEAGNNNLASKHVVGKIEPKGASIPLPTKKPAAADPCKVVAPPANPCAPVVKPVAPVVASPCAPVAKPTLPADPCAPVAKAAKKPWWRFTEQAPAVGTAEGSSSTPWLLRMFSLAVPSLIGMVFFWRRRQAHVASSYRPVAEASEYPEVA
jgi:hypothetical protein